MSITNETSYAEKDGYLFSIDEVESDEESIIYYDQKQEQLPTTNKLISNVECLVNKMEKKLFKTSIENDKFVSSDCTIGDLLSFIIFLLLLITINNAVAPNLLLCAYISMLFSLLFMFMRKYSNSRAFFLISIINGFSICTLGAYNDLTITEGITELYDQGFFSREQYEALFLKNEGNFSVHFGMMCLFAFLLLIESLIEISEEDFPDDDESSLHPSEFIETLINESEIVGDNIV